MNSLFKTTGPLDFDHDRTIYVERPERQDIFREIRRPYVEAAARAGDAAIEGWLDTWFSPECRAQVAAALERMSAKN